MAADLRLMSFVSGAASGDFTGNHAASYSILCGVSGTATIPLRCTSEGVLQTGSNAV